MAFSQAQLDALENAIASGTLEIEYDGNKKKFRSMSELIQARNLLRKELGLTKPGGTTVRVSLNKGL